MSKKEHPIFNKNVGIATAIGTGLGVIAGGKSQQLVAGALFGAGVGALVGWLGNQTAKDENNSSQNKFDNTNDEE